SSNTTVKKIEDFEHIKINSSIFFICENTATLFFTVLILYCSYDHLVCLITGLFCIYAPLGLYSCLSPSLNKLPFEEQKVHLQCLHKGLQVKKLNDEQWAWILHDALGISICLYELKEVHLANIKNCSLFLLPFLVYDVFLVLTTPSLTKCGGSTMEIIALGPFDSAHHEKIPFLLKIPVWYPKSGSDRPSTLLAYSHRFDIQAYSSWTYFVTSAAAYSCGLLTSFVVSSLRHKDQPALFYLVPFILTACLTTRPLPLPHKGSEIQSPKTEIRKGLIQQCNSNTTNNNNNNNSNSDSNEQSKISTDTAVRGPDVQIHAPRAPAPGCDDNPARAPPHCWGNLTLSWLNQDIIHPFILYHARHIQLLFSN
uniref:Uncharacterized protein n=1 Tax=Bubo bubo TaxID=30461 RepID=A0A8C0EAC6_BUBBB